MLQLTQQQMAVFRKLPRQNFEDEMAAYLTQYFPFEAANADLTRWVRIGLDKAGSLGFVTYKESALFLALMAMLGAGFEEDPQIPWAASIASPNEPPLDRITRIYEKAIEHLDATGGPKCAWLVRAKLRVRKQETTVLDKGIHARDVPTRIRELLERLYPQKAAVTGDKAMKQLVKSAIERARKRGSKAPRAAVISAIHMFFLGSDYENDPCYPWAGATLGDVASGSTVAGRFDRMHRASLEYLDRSFQFKG
jgi:hypothetical protein